jgi:hypothetical protein
VRPEILSVKGQQIEGDVGGRVLPGQLGGYRWAGHHPALQLIEVEPAVQPHHRLAVQDDPGR